MADKEVTFDSTSDSAVSYKAQAYDSCGNTDKGSWSGTACTNCGSWEQSDDGNYKKVTISPPSSVTADVDNTYTLTWKSSKVETERTVKVIVKISKPVNWVFTHADGTTTSTVQSTGIDASTTTAVLYAISTKDGADYTTIVVDDESCDWVTPGSATTSGNTSGPNVKVPFTLTSNTSISSRQCEFTIRQSGSGKTLKCKIQQLGKVETPIDLITGMTWTTSGSTSSGYAEVTFNLSTEAGKYGITCSDITISTLYGGSAIQIPAEQFPNHNNSGTTTWSATASVDGCKCRFSWSFSSWDMSSIINGPLENDGITINTGLRHWVYATIPEQRIKNVLWKAEECAYGLVNFIQRQNDSSPATLNFYYGEC